MNRHPLELIEGSRIDGYVLRLGTLCQLSKSGWKGFTLFLEHTVEGFKTSPVVKGIFSKGGKDGVRPWLDIQYWEVVTVQGALDAPTRGLCLTSCGLDTKLFRILATLIPPGGHIMVSYEDEQEIHRETMRSLHLGIPPVATRLGLVLFLAGFEYIKNWYLAEGGCEGPRKLWAEKAADAAVAKEFLEKTADQIRTYLGRELHSVNESDSLLERAGKKRALQVLDLINQGATEKEPQP